MRKVRIGEATIATETFGSPDDPALVLVMGSTASMLGWPEGFCRSLAERGHFVIRYGHRDTGGSTTYPPGTARYAVEDMAANLTGVMDAYQVTKAHLVGMSLGGFIGQVATFRHPDRVASLTLIGSEPLGWDGPPLSHIAPEFMAHFGAMAGLEWSDEEAVADFVAGSQERSRRRG
jgi:pimeloyl-ACP methyl ester carboxylesterase